MSDSVILPNILFTTKLSDKQKSKLKSEYFTFESIPFISFESADFPEWKHSVPIKSDAWAFTSKRSVKAVKPVLNSLSIPKHVFAVGEKTAKKLQELSLSPQVPDEFNVNSLAKLMDEFKLDNVIHFCGNLNSDNLSGLLADKSIKFTSIEVYRTKLTPLKIDEADYDGFVFMSPSAVESFHQKNTLSKQSTVFSIGPSTAKALDKKGISNYKTAEKSTVSSLAESINNFYR